jgi:hypothetical protein
VGWGRESDGLGRSERTIFFITSGKWVIFTLKATESRGRDAFAFVLR